MWLTAGEENIGPFSTDRPSCLASRVKLKPNGHSSPVFRAVISADHTEAWTGDSEILWHVMTGATPKTHWTQDGYSKTRRGTLSRCLWSDKMDAGWQPPDQTRPIASVELSLRCKRELCTPESFRARQTFLCVYGIRTVWKTVARMGPLAFEPPES